MTLEIICSDGEGFYYQDPPQNMGDIQLNPEWVKEVSISGQWLTYAVDMLPYLKAKLARRKVEYTSWNSFTQKDEVHCVWPDREGQVFYDTDAKRIVVVLLEDFNKSEVSKNVTRS